MVKPLCTKCRVQIGFFCKNSDICTLILMKRFWSTLTQFPDKNTFVDLKKMSEVGVDLPSHTHKNLFEWNDRLWLLFGYQIKFGHCEGFVWNSILCARQTWCLSSSSSVVNPRICLSRSCRCSCSSMWFVLAPIRIELLHYCIPVFKILAASCSLIVLLLIFLVQVIYLVSFAPAINVRPLVLQAGLFVGVSTDSWWLTSWLVDCWFGCWSIDQTGLVVGSLII